MLEKVDTEEGFFRKYYNDIEASLNESQKKSFEELKTNEERFQFVLKLQRKHEITLTKVDGSKNYELAIKLKNLGNKAFQEQNYREACKLYTECALKIPWQAGSSSELAVIIANRSAALYHMQEYTLTMADIELSLSLDYPSELRYKIVDRKARCLLAIKQHQDAVLAFRETLTALDSAKLSTERKKKWELDVQIMLGMLGKNRELINAPTTPTAKELPELSGGSSVYKSASTAIRIDQAPSLGRYAVATRDIKVGDTLVFEPAYCSVLLAEHSKTHCFQCFKRVRAPVPCPNCCNVVFCNRKCQRSALSTHHKFECSILPTLWSSGASVTCLMALRIFSQHSLQHFLSIRSQLGQIPQVHQNGNYLDVYNLVTHELKRNSNDLFHRANMAAFLFKCLEISGFFGDQVSNSGENPSPDESFVGGLLLHHLQLLQFNAHEISELVLETNDIETGQSIFLGGGLYPTLALFNHSCDPGVIRYFLGTSVVVRAAKNIHSGDMIAENYGPIFSQIPKLERQHKLKTQYWFTCDCIPCKEDWPMFSDMDPNIMRFKCIGESQKSCTNAIEVSINTMEFIVQCSLCKQYTNILKGLKSLQDTDTLFKRAQSLMMKKEIENALNAFFELLNRLDEALTPPFRDYLLCQQGMRRCMLYQGNHYQKC